MEAITNVGRALARRMDLARSAISMVLAAVVSLNAGACSPARQASHPHAETQRSGAPGENVDTELERISLPSGDQLVVGASKCTGERRQPMLQVRRSDGGTKVLKLAQPLGCVIERDKPGWSGAIALADGEGSAESWFSVRVAPWGGTRAAIVVDQSFGYEHLMHQVRIVLSDGSRFEQVWEYEPALASVHHELVLLDGGRLVHHHEVHSTSLGSPDLVDEYALTALDLDAGGKVVENELDIPMLVRSEHETIDAARMEEERIGTLCPKLAAVIFVLEKSPTPTGPRYLVGVPLMKADAEQAARRALGSCMPESFTLTTVTGG